MKMRCLIELKQSHKPLFTKPTLQFFSGDFEMTPYVAMALRNEMLGRTIGVIIVRKQS